MPPHSAQENVIIQKVGITNPESSEDNTYSNSGKQTSVVPNSKCHFPLEICLSNEWFQVWDKKPQGEPEIFFNY